MPARERDAEVDLGQAEVAPMAGFRAADVQRLRINASAVLVALR